MDTIMLELDSFEHITLDEMRDIRLMNRIDTKYVVESDKLPELLSMLSKDYYIQEDLSSGKRSFEYLTLYYDTPKYDMYVTHQNGKLNRFKIRTREYCDSNLFFLEIKHKTNKGLTSKIRIENNDLESINRTDSKRFIEQNSPFSTSVLETKLKSRYQRITLVNKNKSERLTIDYELGFQNICTESNVTLPNLTIIEVKSTRNAISPAEKTLKKLKIKPYRLSKYCLGTALTDSSVKKNRIKHKIHQISKLTDIHYD